MGVRATQQADSREARSFSVGFALAGSFVLIATHSTLISGDLLESWFGPILFLWIALLASVVGFRCCGLRSDVKAGLVVLVFSHSLTYLAGKVHWTVPSDDGGALGEPSVSFGGVFVLAACAGVAAFALRREFPAYTGSQFDGERKDPGDNRHNEQSTG